jgi:hypothetical protein
MEDTKMQEEKVSRADAYSIWKNMSPARWLALLKHFAPRGRWTKSGAKIVGMCPYHPQTQRGSFAVMADRGFAKCLSASCQAYERDPVALVAHVLAVPYGEALKTAFVDFSNVKLRRKQIEEIGAAQNAALVKASLLGACKSVLQHALSNPSDAAYEYAQAAVAWCSSRHIDLGALPSYAIGVLPTRRHLEQRVPEADMRSQVRAYVNERSGSGGGERADLLPMDPDGTNIWVGAVVFGYHRELSTLGRLKVRPLRGDAPSIWLGPYEQPGVFGLGLYSKLYGTPAAADAVVVEGEMDAIALYQAQISSGSPVSRVVVAASGGGMGRLLPTARPRRVGPRRDHQRPRRWGPASP